MTPLTKKSWHKTRSLVRDDPSLVFAVWDWYKEQIRKKKVWQWVICGHHQMNHLVQSYLRVKHDQFPIILMIVICVAHVVETLHWSTAEHWSLITITGLCSGLHWSPLLIGITCYHSDTAVLWPLTNNIVIPHPSPCITTNSDNCCSQLCTWYLHFTSLLVFQSKHEGETQRNAIHQL